MADNLLMYLELFLYRLGDLDVHWTSAIFFGIDSLFQSLPLMVLINMPQGFFLQRFSASTSLFWVFWIWTGEECIYKRKQELSIKLTV